MQRVDFSASRGGTFSDGRFKPKAINAVCPYCNEKGTFSLGSFAENGPLQSLSATGRCPTCGKGVGFWSVNPEGNADKEGVELFMHPSSKRMPYPEGEEDIPPQLYRALTAAIDSYNSENYSGAAVAGRRTLEGIFKYLLPQDERSRNLSRLIEGAKGNEKLAESLTRLSHLVREGGNLGAHFDLDREPTEPLASHIVDLVSYLAAYFYVLPARIRKLEEELERLSTPKD